jgi:hypothetical protein
MQSLLCKYGDDVSNCTEPRSSHKVNWPDPACPFSVAMHYSITRIPNVTYSPGEIQPDKGDIVNGSKHFVLSVLLESS